MLKVFELKGEGGYSVALHLPGPLDSLAPDTCCFHSVLVCVELDGYSAMQGACFEREDLADFLSRIASAAIDLSGTAVLADLEERVELTVATSARGRVLIKCRLRKSDADVELAFSFETDQSYLSNSLLR